MARFKKFYQRISHDDYDELLVGELQVDSRLKDPDVHLRISHMTKRPNLVFQRNDSIIVTKLSAFFGLANEMNSYRIQKFCEREAKKVAKS